LQAGYRQGHKKRREAGKWLGSVPLGYEAGGDKLVPGPPEAVALVRRIFETRAKGYGLHKIAKQLNDDNVPTPRGKKWWYNPVKHILDRESYIGNLVAGKQSRAKFAQAIELGSRIEGTHEPIISREPWDKLQAMTTRPMKAHDRCGSKSSPLAGLVTCAGCDKPMHQDNSVGRRYFICSTYTGCSSAVCPQRCSKGVGAGPHSERGSYGRSQADPAGNRRKDRFVVYRRRRIGQA